MADVAMIIPTMENLLLTMSVTILGQAIMAKMAILVVMAWLIMATDMGNSDFLANIRINVDHLGKRN